MHKLDEYEKYILKNALCDYSHVKRFINGLIRKYNNCDMIVDHLRHINAFDMYSIDKLSDGTYNYIDFTYNNINASIYVNNGEIKFGMTFEVYNDYKEEYIIEDCLSYDEWEKILDEGGY